jgi:hypothetical protein
MGAAVAEAERARKARKARIAKLLSNTRFMVFPHSVE